MRDWKDSYRNDKQKFQNSEIERRKEIENRLKEAESYITKLKNEKEELKQLLEVKNSTQPSTDFIKKIKESILIRDNEIKRLKELNEKYTDETKKNKNVKDPKEIIKEKVFFFF